MRKNLFIYSAIFFLSSGLASAQNWYFGKVTALNFPTARFGSAFANNAATGNDPLFGGLGASPGGPVAFGDTWILAANGWTQVFPANSPSPRYGTVMVYDALHSQSVLFGGALWANNGMAFALGETWSWNGTNWTQLAPATSPSPRFFHTMVYDKAHSQTVLFGGVTADGFNAETWVYDGTTWTQKFPAHSPSARAAQAMVFDNNNSAVMLFGGVNQTTSYGDTWLWNGTDWTQLSPANSPSGRYGCGIAYDVPEGQTILFAGTNAGGNLQETWAWSGTTWTQLNPVSVPQLRFYTMMTFDPVVNRILMYGGGLGSSIGDLYQGDSWSWY